MDGVRNPATSRPPPNPAMPYREDCWSEGETSALVDAWGDRYLELSRGNLRQKHWQEVADAVNSRPGATGRRPPRTDVQCKNRIDTLKKKYKVEKSRVGPASGAVSQWPFFSRLDALIGPSAIVASSSPATSKKRSLSPPLALPLPFHRKGSPLPTAAAVTAAAVRPLQEKKRQVAAPAPAAALSIDDSFYRRAAAAAAAAEDDDDDQEDSKESLPPPCRPSSRSGRPTWNGKVGESEVDGIRHLASAITKFAEIYERAEADKLLQMVELEKQRMEFAKMLEFQRMQLFVDFQVQVEKIKRVKRSDSEKYRRNGRQAYGDLMR